MPPLALENQVLDLLVQKVNEFPQASWRTSPKPTAVEGTPLDPLPEGDSPVLRVQWIDTRESRAEDAAGTTVTAHGFRCRLIAWCIAKSVHAATELMADVRDVLYASEGAFTSSFQQPAWTTGGRYRDDLSDAGKHVVELPIFMDFESLHAA